MNFFLDRDRDTAYVGEDVKRFHVVVGNIMITTWVLPDRIWANFWPADVDEREDPPEFPLHSVSVPFSEAEEK